MTDTEAFVDRVLHQLDEIIEEYPEIDRSRAFVIWLLESIGGLDRDDAYESSQMGGPGDLGVDAVVRSDALHLVTILQAKFSETAEASAPRLEIADFRGTTERLLDPATLPDRDEVIRAKNDLQHAVKHAYRIHAVFAVLGSFTEDAQAEIRRILDEWHPTTEFRFYDLANIKDLVERTPLKPVTLELIPSQSFHRITPTKALVATVKAASIAQLYHDRGDSIFVANPRLYLGKSNRVNKGIQETLEEDTQRTRFWNFNNGVSFVCDDFILDHPTPNIVTVMNPRIVNGCQTTKTLFRCQPFLRDEVQLLIRLTVTGADSEFEEDISNYTNRQSAIKGRDLVSNTQDQIKLQRSFSDMGYYYERKRGGWASLNAVEKKAYPRGSVPNDRAGRALLALNGDPRKALRTSEEVLFDEENDDYQNVFGKASGHRLALAFELDHAISLYSRQLVRELHAAETVSADQRNQGYLLGLKIGKFFILGIIGNCIDALASGLTEDDKYRLFASLNESAKADLVKQAVMSSYAALSDILVDEFKEQPFNWEMQLREYLLTQSVFNRVLEKRKRLLLVIGGKDPIADGLAAGMPGKA